MIDVELLYEILEDLQDYFDNEQIETIEFFLSMIENLL